MRMCWVRATFVPALTLAVVVPGLVALLGGSAGASAWRDGRCRSGVVALTFDDGPAAPTDRLVHILRGAHVPATFFMVGQRVAAMPSVARRVERAGFLIGNHSWAHDDMTKQTSAQVTATLRSTAGALRRAGTHPTRLMRPPYGALDAAARNGIRRAGFIPVLWTIDSRDWESGTSGQIAARILAGLRPHGTNIVLQHDGVGRSPISVGAVPLVIRAARARGYCFVALDERGRPGFPTPSASVSVTDAREGEPVVATVRLDRPAGRATSVFLRTRSRSATLGRDVARVDRRVTIPAGRLAVRVRIPVRKDGTDEPRERFEVRIDRPRRVRIGDGSALAWISDIDLRPRIVGVNATVTEPTDAPESVNVVFRLSHVSGRWIRIVVVTQPGTADGTDYTPIRISSAIPPRHGSTVVPVDVLPDAVLESDEKFSVRVVRGRHVRIGRPATVTIVPPPSPDELTAPEDPHASAGDVTESDPKVFS